MVVIPSTWTPRELQILRLALAGLGRHEIARELGISPLTVRNLLRYAFERHGVASLTHLVGLAVAERAITADELAGLVRRYYVADDVFEVAPVGARQACA